MKEQARQTDKSQCQELEELKQTSETGQPLLFHAFSSLPGAFGFRMPAARARIPEQSWSMELMAAPMTIDPGAKLSNCLKQSLLQLQDSMPARIHSHVVKSAVEMPVDPGPVIGCRIVWLTSAALVSKGQPILRNEILRIQSRAVVSSPVQRRSVCNHALSTFPTAECPACGLFYSSGAFHWMLVRPGGISTNVCPFTILETLPDPRNSQYSPVGTRKRVPEPWD